MTEPANGTEIELRRIARMLEKTVEMAQDGEMTGSLAERKNRAFATRRAICARTVADVDAALAAAGTANARVNRIAVLTQTTQNVAWFKTCT